ncbi:MAG: cytidine deaminase [Lachnospiraceae bacterium]|nr:cytidine deaminase [Lachnospiraceae bacterium]
MKKEFKKLMIVALEARNFSYAPYSEYTVGAALLCADGRIVTGSNIENASYGATVCAERTAFFKAVSEGEKDFVAIAIAGGKKDEEPVDFAYPCGVCRQVMREFCDETKFKVFVVKSETEYEEYVLGNLLPKSFGPNNLSDTSKKK